MNRSSPDKHSRGRDAFQAAGSSPTVHLLGAGKVGQCFLDLCAAHGLRLVSVTDSSGTLYSKAGLDAAPLAALKRAGGSFAEGAKAEPLPLETALRVVDADVVVDCLPTDLDELELAAARVRQLLDNGQAVILASKSALLGDTETLLENPRRSRLGICALLGGTGQALMNELEELRVRTQRILCVPNATTSLLVGEIEAGASWEQAIDRARVEGLFESDPQQDLSGRDAALKLCILSRAVLQRRCELGEVLLPDAGIDVELLRERALRGRTTRLLGSASRELGPELRYEELPRASRLTVPWRRVAYGYELDDGSLRLHLGDGVGPRATAEAVLRDYLALCPAPSEMKVQ